MKTRTRFLLSLSFTALVSFLFTGCYYEDPYGPTPYPPHGGGGGHVYPGGSSAYNTGMSYGSSDARRGLSRQASRHWHQVPAAQRETFAQGYNVGYQRNQGGGHGGGHVGGANEAYDKGMYYGRMDARRGYARQASRHWTVVPAAQRKVFAQGYNAAYVRN